MAQPTATNQSSRRIGRRRSQSDAHGVELGIASSHKVRLSTLTV
jgi:hypothetical protein